MIHHVDHSWVAESLGEGEYIETFTYDPVTTEIVYSLIGHTGRIHEIAYFAREQTENVQVMSVIVAKKCPDARISYRPKVERCRQKD